MKINGDNNQSRIEITVRGVDTENITRTIISESRTGRYSFITWKMFIMLARRSTAKPQSRMSIMSWLHRNFHYIHVGFGEVVV